MYTQELLLYVQSQRSKNLHPNAIKAILLSYKWKEQDIHEVFSVLNISIENPKVEKYPTHHPQQFPTTSLITISLSVVLSLFFASSFLFLNAQTKLTSVPKVVTPLAMLSPNPTPTPVQIPSPTLVAGISASTNKTVLGVSTQAKHVSIAIIGDSMVDTMGEHLEFLQQSLAAKYPQDTFDLYNYGIGAQNVEEGLNRFSTPFSYKTRNYPSLSFLHPNIIVVASFSYNPFSPFDRAKHTSDLEALVQDAKQTGAKVYLLAEIAPLQFNFAKGPSGISEWTDEYRAQHALEIVEQLQDTEAIAQQVGVPLIDAYAATRNSNGFGSPTYTSAGDGIHPSSAGHVLMANLITSTIKF